MEEQQTHIDWGLNPLARLSVISGLRSSFKSFVAWSA